MAFEKMLPGFFVLGAIMAPASAPFAQTSSRPASPLSAGAWKLIMESTEKAYVPAAFEDLRARHADVLADIDPQSVTWAQVDVKRYGWFGETSCDAGDARLTVTGKGFSYCLDRGNNGVTACSAGSSTPAMGKMDPCAR